MSVKTFRAESMQAALALVRQELGPQAAVLESREVRTGVMGWLGGSRWIEVTASARVAVPSRLPALPRPSHLRSKLALQAARGLDLGLECPNSQSGSATAASGPGTYDSPDAGLWRCDDDPPWPARLCAYLVAAGVADVVAGEVIRELSATGSLAPQATLSSTLRGLARVAGRRIKIAEPLDQRAGRQVIVLVGPTGVGKTTTVAKLAAGLRLQGKRRVGILLADTQRLQTSDQLRSCAGLLDIPLEIVSNAQEMRKAASMLSDNEVILVDTAGSNPRDTDKLQELRDLATAAEATEVWLVASCTSSQLTLETLIDRFRPIGASTAVLTKLDEVDSVSHMLALALSNQLTVSYVSFGQRIPDDIEPADPFDLAQRMVSTVDLSS